MTGRAGLKLSPIRMCEWDMLLLLKPNRSWVLNRFGSGRCGGQDAVTAAKRPSVLPYA